MDELITRLLEPGLQIRVQDSIALPWFEGEQAQERHYRIIGKARLDAPRSRYYLHKWAHFLAGDWYLLIDVLRDLAHCTRNPCPTLPWLATRTGLSYTTLYRMIGAGGFYWKPTVKIKSRPVPILEIPDRQERRYQLLRWLGVRWYIPQIIGTGHNTPYRIVPLMGDVLHPDQRPELWDLFEGLLRPDQTTLLEDAEYPWQQYDFPSVPLLSGGAEIACPSTEEG